MAFEFIVKMSANSMKDAETALKTALTVVFTPVLVNNFNRNVVTATLIAEVLRRQPILVVARTVPVRTLSSDLHCSSNYVSTQTKPSF